MHKHRNNINDKFMVLNSRNIFLFLIAAIFSSRIVAAADYEVVSPDNKLKIILHIDNGTTYEIYHGENKLISPSSIALHLDDKRIIGGGSVKETERRSVDEIIEVPIGKNKSLNEVYNELTIRFEENYDLVVRAYNEGIAYRFVTDLEGEITIDTEDMVLNFSSEPLVFFPEANNLEHWEKSYQQILLNSIAEGKFAVSPILFSFPDTPYKIAVTEADTYDYPGLYIRTNGSNSMRGMWAKYPKTVQEPDNIYSNHVPLTRFDYIARTTGSRTFPWRVFIVTDDDKSLLNNELVYMLAEPQRLTDVSWIKPGKSTWEWWHKAMLEGVNFPVGNDNLGFTLYKYYVDFAAKNNITYLTLDAGWSENYIKRLCDYARGKGVKIIVWTWASNVLDPGQEGWLKKMKNYGISGVKIDFFQRSDQPSMTWGHRLGQELADLEMVGIFHGCPVPTGLNRTYPNILNFEAVLGNEENFWRRGCNPDYHATFPFIRTLAGPVDFTPGSMRNKTANQFVPVDKPNTVPSTTGTRAHELSMYVIFDQWMGFLCDAPTEYEKYPDILDFLSTVPTVWDKTLPLDAKVGEYISIAKKSGNDWYVGGMSNWSTALDLPIKFDFLEAGKRYKATVIRDGSNAANYPTRYISEVMILTCEDELTLQVAKGGGFVIRLIEDGNSGIDGNKKKAIFSIRTDTSRNIMTIESEEPLQSIGIYDSSGRLAFNKLYDNSKYETIDLNSFPKGIYLLKLDAKNAKNSAKFIN